MTAAESGCWKPLKIELHKSAAGMFILAVYRVP